MQIPATGECFSLWHRVEDAPPTTATWSLVLARHPACGPLAPLPPVAQRPSTFFAPDSGHEMFRALEVRIGDERMIAVRHHETHVWFCMDWC
jgi:hypothetical protein